MCTRPSSSLVGRGLGTRLNFTSHLPVSSHGTPCCFAVCHLTVIPCYLLIILLLLCTVHLAIYHLVVHLVLFVISLVISLLYTPILSSHSPSYFSYHLTVCPANLISLCLCYYLPSLYDFSSSMSYSTTYIYHTFLLYFLSTPLWEQPRNYARLSRLSCPQHTHLSGQFRVLQYVSCHT